MTEREIREIPSDWQGYRGCSWFTTKPTYRPCGREATHLIVTQVRASNKRNPYQHHRLVCQEHLPAQRPEPGPPEPDMVTMAEAAEIIGITVAGLSRMTKRSKGPRPVVINRRYWYRRGEVESFGQAYRLVNSSWLEAAGRSDT